jgi:hypothetical protein
MPGPHRRDLPCRCPARILRDKRDLLGKGERTGNAPLELILLHLIGMGYYADCRPDFTVLNELGELYSIAHFQTGKPNVDFLR